MLTNTFSYKNPLSHKPTPEQTHRGCRLMTLALIYDDKVKKMPDELLRTVYSRNSAQYSHIAKLALPFYAHIGAGH